MGTHPARVMGASKKPAMVGRFTLMMLASRGAMSPASNTAASIRHRFGSAASKADTAPYKPFQNEAAAAQWAPGGEASPRTSFSAEHAALLRTNSVICPRDPSGGYVPGASDPPEPIT